VKDAMIKSSSEMEAAMRADPTIAALGSVLNRDFGAE